MPVNDMFIVKDLSTVTKRLVRRSKKLDMEVAILHDDLIQVCNFIGDEKNILKEIQKDIEDGHVGTILLNEISWRLRGS